MKKMNPVVHFEMPATDMDRMKKFYETAFGWQTNQLGEEMGNYVSVMTVKTDEVNQQPIVPGAINGGFYHRSEDSQRPSIVIAVDDIYESMKAVKALGGKILGGSRGEDKPDDIPGVGLFSGAVDTEGNYFAMLQPKNE